MIKILLHKREFSTDAVEEVKLDTFSLSDIHENKLLKSYFIKNFGLIEIEIIWVNSLFDFNSNTIVKYENDIKMNKKSMAMLDVSLNELESKIFT